MMPDIIVPKKSKFSFQIGLTKNLPRKLDLICSLRAKAGVILIIY